MNLTILEQVNSSINFFRLNLGTKLDVFCSNMVKFRDQNICIFHFRKVSITTGNFRRRNCSFFLYIFQDMAGVVCDRCHSPLRQSFFSSPINNDILITSKKICFGQQKNDHIDVQILGTWPYLNNQDGPCGPNYHGLPPAPSYFCFIFGGQFAHLLFLQNSRVGKGGY